MLKKSLQFKDTIQYKWTQEWGSQIRLYFWVRFIRYSTKHCRETRIPLAYAFETCRDPYPVIHQVTATETDIPQLILSMAKTNEMIHQLDQICYYMRVCGPELLGRKTNGFSK